MYIINNIKALSKDSISPISMILLYVKTNKRNSEELNF